MKKIAILLIVLLIVQLIPFECFKVLANAQQPPIGFTVASSGGKPVISYSSDKGYYAKLTWSPPVSWDGDNQFYELDYRADNDGVYQMYDGTISKDQTEIEMQHLKSGTVYHAHLHAIHQHIAQESGQVTQTDSTPTNDILFMTDTSITLQPADNSTLNIKWDKVDYSAASVSYEVYISESASFAQTSPIFIGSNDIGAGKVVQVDGDQLVYNATDLKAGTVYYVKIKTIINDANVICLPVSAPKDGYTRITGQISKVYSSWWKLEWNNITNTNLSSGEQILYRIFRCEDGDLEKELLATKDTSLLVRVNDNNTYFRIEADLVSQLGDTLNIESDDIYAKENESLVVPPVPVILHDPTQQHTEVGSDNITLLWEAPYTTLGTIDTDIAYDIWILTNPSDLDDSSVAPTVANLKVTSSDYVHEMIGNTQGNRVIGFKHTFSGLTPNSVYYVKMVAKKTYTVNQTTQTVSSEAALEDFITLANEDTDQPIAPAVPPFKVKTQTVNGSEVQVTTADSVTLQWKNKWYEVWNDADSKWVYLDDNDVQDAAVAGEVYKLVKYDSDIKFSVGYEVYTDDFDFSRLSETTSTMPMQFNNIANNSKSDTVEFTVTGLQANTPYVMWMRAYRSDSLKSELSDPIIVNTKPSYETPIQKPSIPIFNYKNQGDTYIELGWNIQPEYYYNLKYSTSDNISTATEAIEITPDDLKNKSTYTVEDLAPNTTYYFWIQAKIVDGEDEQESEWSDSYIAATSAYEPPAIPTGFGIKNMDNAVGKDFINFQWLKVDGLEYTIELATKKDFSDVVSYPVKEVSEYKVEGLNPNTRYYARLYAYNPDTKLSSKYTSIISAKTLASSDEYNTGADTEQGSGEIPKPEFDENDSNTALLDVKHAQTDAFIEQIFSSQSSELVVNYAGLNPEESSDTKHAKGVGISKTRISPRILEALGQKKMDLILDNGPAVLTIKPGIMENDILKQKFIQNPECILELELRKVSNPTNKTNGSSYISDVWRTSVVLETAAGRLQIPTLKDLSIKIPYYKSNWFDKSTMSGYAYDANNQKWIKAETTSSFDLVSSEGTVASIIPGSCDFAVMKMVGGKFSDISSSPYAAKIKAITDKYNLKCLGNESFQPSKTVSKEEAVKILLDVLGYDYAQDYITPAKKAGIIANIDLTKEQASATREQAGAMISRVYEMLTGNKAYSANISASKYSDGSKIDKNLSTKVLFAAANGILDVSGNAIRPKSSFTRGEMMAMIYNMLQKAGVM